MGCGRCHAPVRGAARIRSTASPGSFMISCDQTSTAVRARPLVDLLGVDGVVDAHGVQQVEQEQWHVGVRAGRDVRHRRDPGDPGVQLAQVHRAGVDVDQHVDLEEALVVLLGQPVTQLADVADRDGPVGLGQRLGEQVVAAQGALVRGELGVAGQVGHERPGRSCRAG